MRVYEFSKKYNIPTKELMEALQKADIAVKSHMSLIDDKTIEFLQKTFEKTTLSTKEASKKAKILKTVSKPKPQVTDKSKTVLKPKEPKEKVGKPEKKETEKLIVTSMSVGDAALKLNQPVNDVILTLLRWGIVAAKNQVLSEEVVQRLADHYEIETVKFVEEKQELKKEIDLKGVKLKSRLPIVVVLGHVDHGKTTLLDFIRKSRVALKEKGGITQHIGAYEATTEQGNIIFLDTPGHEAFSKIRQRGARVADIAILVIAADDGVMPQTIEAIRHIKTMAIPVIVAINKIDKVDPSRIEIVKRELAQHDVLPEDWGGDAVCIPISAKDGTGVDHLLEMVILQAQMMELRADLSGAAKGYVLESKFEKGYGPIATIICQHGQVKRGDFFVCGDTVGKVTSLIDSYGKRVQQAGPSIPVQVAGFEVLPEVGDYFEVVAKERYLQKRSERQERKTSLVGRVVKQEGAINLIIKADTNSSQEALLDSIDRLSRKSDRGFNIIDSRVGDISESDVELAFNTGSSIVGLHVKTEANASSLAQERGVSILLFDIIYKLLEDLEKRAIKPAEVEIVRTKVGEATVLRVFDIKKVGVVAGSYVKEGRFVVGGHVDIWRSRQKIGEGKIISLQREKKSIKEAHAGFECGFVVEGFRDWAVDDKVECFIQMPKK